MGSKSPASLYILTIADSGEGKTPTDRFFTAAIREFEEKQAQITDNLNAQHRATQDMWEMKLNEIQSAIKKATKNQLTTNNDNSNVNIENLENELRNHYSKEPKEQPQYQIFHNDTTPQKLIKNLSENVPTVYLNSDEGGSLFQSNAINNLGILNNFWDGSPISMDRVSTQSIHVKNARLSIFIAVQKNVLIDYLNGRGKSARSIGFLSRGLVTNPFSTKGSRILNGKLQSSKCLNIYHQRVTEILEQDKCEFNQGREDRLVLKFSLEAKEHWCDFRNRIESNLYPGQYLSDIDDFASKITTNVCRMAALFHFFEGVQGDISVNTFTQARRICCWYIDEFKMIFSNSQALVIPLEISDVTNLELFFWDWTQKHRGDINMAKSLISQYGPSQLRSNKVRREHAINELVRQNKIQVFRYNNKKFIAFNHIVFPACTPLHHQNANIQPTHLA